VLEDGKPQTVTIFEEHKATDVQEAAKGPVLPPHVYSNLPTCRIASAANVLLLDALNTPLNDQNYARQQMLNYLHTIPAGTQIAVFTLASRLRMVSGFTTDAEAIEQALNLRHTPTQKSVGTLEVRNEPGTGCGPSPVAGNRAAIRTTTVRCCLTGTFRAGSRRLVWHRRSETRG
jgi:VWFA-related protein